MSRQVTIVPCLVTLILAYMSRLLPIFSWIYHASFSFLLFASFSLSLSLSLLLLLAIELGRLKLQKINFCFCRTENKVTWHEKENCSITSYTIPVHCLSGFYFFPVCWFVGFCFSGWSKLLSELVCSLQVQSRDGKKENIEIKVTLTLKMFWLSGYSLRVRFFGKIQIRILVSKNGFCVSLPISENGLITD